MPVPTKTLLLLRHAKSSWSEPGLSDHERPLNARGKRDAPTMGRLLAQQGLEPDLIISSTAVRAVKTASKVAKNCGYTGRVLTRGELYHGDLEDFITVLADSPDTCSRVILVGHNPGMEIVLDHLTGRDEPMPTAALAQIELPLERWPDLGRQTSGRLVQIWRPKELADA